MTQTINHLPRRRQIASIAAALSITVLAGSALAQNAPVRVGSKIDTEGKLLGNMIVLALEAGGVKTENKTALGNTKILRSALIAGEIDIYPEYTGNGAFMFAEESNPVWKNAKAGYERVKALDMEKNKLVWLEPSPPTTPGRLRFAKTSPPPTSSRRWMTWASGSTAAGSSSWLHRRSL